MNSESKFEEIVKILATAKRIEEADVLGGPKNVVLHYVSLYTGDAGHSPPITIHKARASLGNYTLEIGQKFVKDPYEYELRPVQEEKK